MARSLPKFAFRTVPELLWERDPTGYKERERWSAPGPLDDDEFEPVLETVIVPCGNGRNRYALWGADPLVFLSLVNPARPKRKRECTRTSVEGALDFANQWGLLTNHNEMLLSDFVAKCGQISGALQRIRDGIDPIRLPRWANEGDIVPDNKSIYRKSRSLWMYCCLQLEAHVRGGAEFRNCQRCNDVFVPSRDNEIYCGDSCRKRFSEEQPPRRRRRG